MEFKIGNQYQYGSTGAVYELEDIQGTPTGTPGGVQLYFTLKGGRPFLSVLDIHLTLTPKLAEKYLQPLDSKKKSK